MGLASRFSRLVAASTLLAALPALPAAAQAQQEPPVFRAGVDLVTVDVAVVDKNGKPVTGLLPRDFSVLADKRPRRILSADFVSAVSGRSTPVVTKAPVAGVPRPTTNTPPSGRSFLFIVDVEEMGQGSGHAVMKAIGDYLDRLVPDDRVGLVSVPYYSPRVDLTTNRDVIRRAAGLTVGASARNQDDMMTVGEASAVEALDCTVLLEYLHRLNKIRDDQADCGGGLLLEWIPAAVAAMDAERRHTRELFDTLRALATSMASIEGPKSLILVSQGIVSDRETLEDLSRFAAAAEKARVTLYALNLDIPLTDVTTQYNVTGAHVYDHRVLLDGMATLAIAGRGDVFLVSGTATTALERIDAEMAGYYLLSFERDPRERDGQREKIEVTVNWPGAMVRARTEFTADRRPLPKPAIPSDPKAAIGQLLRWPVPNADLGIDLDAYAAPSLDPPGAIRTVLAASLATDAKTIAAAGYEVVDEAGRIVSDDFLPIAGSRSPVPTQVVAGGRKLYVRALDLKPGRYRVKFAAIDANGRRGSVEHAFEVAVPAAGVLRVGDVILGEVTRDGFLPSPTSAQAQDRLPLRVEVLAGSPAAFGGATMTLELARGPNVPPLATSPLSWVSTDDERRRFASATLAIAALPPGDYLVTAVLRTADGASARTSRGFTKK